MWMLQVGVCLHATSTGGGAGTPCATGTNTICKAPALHNIDNWRRGSECIGCSAGCDDGSGAGWRAPFTSGGAGTPSAPGTDAVCKAPVVALIGGYACFLYR